MPKFSTAWDESKPAGTRSKLFGDDDIREFKQQFRERFGEDHYTLANESDDSLVGFHIKSTFIEQASNPSAVTNCIILYAKDDGTSPELHTRHETAGITQITRQGKLLLSALGIASEAQGDLIIRGASAWGRLGIGTAFQRPRVNTGATALEYVDNIKKSVFFFIPSSLSTGTRKSARIYVPFDGTITKWILDAATAPTGASIIVDINKNGSTIWSTQANRATIAAAASSGNGTTFDTTAVTAGDYFDVDVDQVGSTVAGADLTVILEILPK